MNRRGFILFAGAAATLRAQAETFEIATVKRSPETGADRIDINLGRIRDGTLTLANASLADCLRFAYSLPSNAQIVGPDWIRAYPVRFDIVAQIPKGATREQLLGMLQALLKDRLKLQLREDQRVLPHLALIEDKGGSKLKPGKMDAPPQGSNLLGKITSTQMSIATLAMLLSRFERVTIVDRTGLKGMYEVELQWAHDNNRPITLETEPPDAPNAPSLFTAVREQLGLRLESRKGPIEVLVVEHAEQVPVEN